MRGVISVKTEAFDSGILLCLLFIFLINTGQNVCLRVLLNTGAGEVSRQEVRVGQPVAWSSRGFKPQTPEPWWAVRRQRQGQPDAKGSA